MPVKVTRIAPSDGEHPQRIQAGDQVVYHRGEREESEQHGSCLPVLAARHDEEDPRRSVIQLQLMPGSEPVWVPLAHVNLFAKVGTRPFGMPDTPQPIAND